MFALRAIYSNAPEETTTVDYSNDRLELELLQLTAEAEVGPLKSWIEWVEPIPLPELDENGFHKADYMQF
jgi:hypothetical protein